MTKTNKRDVVQAFVNGWNVDKIIRILFEGNEAARPRITAVHEQWVHHHAECERETIMEAFEDIQQPSRRTVDDLIEAGWDREMVEALHREYQSNRLSNPDSSLEPAQSPCGEPKLGNSEGPGGSKRKADDTQKKVKETEKRPKGFVDCGGFNKVTGPGWSCLQDSLAMAGKLLGLDIKDEIYKHKRPRKTKGTSIEELKPVLKDKIEFEYISIMQEKGGPTFGLLHLDPGIYIVSAMCGTPHTFVYNQGVLPGPYHVHIGAIIDNRKTAPIRLVEEADRASVQSARSCIETFFKGRVQIDLVYRSRLSP